MLLSQFAIPYVTRITHYAKSLELLQPKYEMIPIAVIYNLASIAKIGYKDTDNNGFLLKSEVLKMTTMKVKKENQLKI